MAERAREGGEGEKVRAGQQTQRSLEGRREAKEEEVTD